MNIIIMQVLHETNIYVENDGPKQYFLASADCIALFFVKITSWHLATI